MTKYLLFLYTIISYAAQLFYQAKNMRCIFIARYIKWPVPSICLSVIHTTAQYVMYLCTFVFLDDAICSLIWGHGQNQARHYVSLSSLGGGTSDQSNVKQRCWSSSSDGGTVAKSDVCNCLVLKRNFHVPALDKCSTCRSGRS